MPQDGWGQISRELIAQRYQLVKSLGSGPSGVTYYAHDIKFEPPRVIVVKRLNRERLNDQTRAQLNIVFSQLAQLNPPNVLPVLDFDLQHDPPYIVSEYVEGVSLEGLWRPNPTEPPHRLPADMVLKIVRQISTILTELHNDGLAHGNLTLSNTLIVDKRVVLTDCGVEAILENRPVSSLYDIQSLARLTYLLLTGQTKYRLKKSPLSPALNQLFVNTFSGEAWQQPTSAANFYELLEAVLNEPVPEPEPPHHQIERAAPDYRHSDRSYPHHVSKKRRAKLAQQNAKATDAQQDIWSWVVGLIAIVGMLLAFPVIKQGAIVVPFFVIIVAAVIQSLLDK